MNEVQRYTFESKRSRFECLSRTFVGLSYEVTHLVVWSVNLHITALKELTGVCKFVSGV